MEIILQILMILYFGSGILLTVIKFKSIWKGICGGNGIPQTDELVKANALLTFYFECGLIMFFERKVDYGFLTLLLTTLGISSIASSINKKPKPS